MSKTIYYFTGTGNSLVIARKLAEGLGETEVLSMGMEINASPKPTDRTIGFVFPTYAYGLPRMVREFAENISLPKDAYVFAVASNFGIPGKVLTQLNRILRKKGRGLDAGFAVLDKRSSLIEDPDNDLIQRMMISANRGWHPIPSSDRMEEMIETIGAKRRHRLETSNGLTNLLGSLLYPLALKTFKGSGEHLWTDGSCSGCGTCVKICPRNNIQIVDSRPVWGDDCELCHACLQWCRKSAIQYKHLTEGKERYRNTAVSIKDMVLR